MPVTVVVSLDEGLRSIGRNEKGHETIFDTSVAGGGTGSAAGPMEILLEAAAACSVMDVVGMLRKRRKNVIGLSIEMIGERREEEPRIYTAVKMIYRLTSPDITKEELDKCIVLSYEKYCSVTATLRLAGADVTWESSVDGDATLSNLAAAEMPL